MFKENVPLYKIDSESGSILALFVISLTLLIALTALTIDVNQAYSGKEETNYYTRLAALGALEEYNSAEGCSDGIEGDSEMQACRLAKAFSKAEQLLRGNRLTISRSSDIELKQNSTRDSNDSHSAYFEAGRWVEGAENCGDDSSNACFLSAASSPSSSINAIRINGSGYKGVKGFFSNIFSGSHEDYKFGVDVVASIVPRWGCFLVDVSPSIMRTTHRGTFQYSYFDRSINRTPPGENSWAAFVDNAPWQTMTRSYPTRPEASGESEDPNLHYASDYRKKYLASDADYSESEFPLNITPSRFPQSDTKRRWAWIDTYRSISHTGPEPLSTVLAGLKQAISEFKNRRVAGDKACIIFYDSRVSWNRIIPPTDDFDMLEEYVDTSISSQFLEDDVDSNSSKNVSGIAKMTRLGWYPIGGYDTDTALALKTALNLLEEEVGSSKRPISRFIVSIGDGLVNCVDCDPTVQDCTYRCLNTYANYTAAYNELANIVTTDMEPNNIPFHTILTGEQVGPHTVDIPIPGTNPPECYDDKGYRASGSIDPFGFVRPLAADGYDPESRFITMAPYRPFYDAAYNMYRLSVITRGLYGPIRPPGDPSSCSGTPPCEEGKRRTTDSLCRSEQDQIKQYMQDIIGANPYRIVDIH